MTGQLLAILMVASVVYYRAVMGYEVHVTRRENWWDEDGGEISAQEWAAAVCDLAMVPVPEGWSGQPQWVAEMTTGPAPEFRTEGLYWSAGRIVAKHPTDALITKMCQVARVLGARVQGDDGEYYDG